MLGKLFKGDRKKSTTSSQQRTISYEELEKEFAKMVAELRLPAQAAQNMLKMPQAQKIEMLKAHKVKKQTVCCFFVFFCSYNTTNVRVAIRQVIQSILVAIFKTKLTAKTRTKWQRMGK